MEAKTAFLFLIAQALPADSKIIAATVSGLINIQNINGFFFVESPKKIVLGDFKTVLVTVSKSIVKQNFFLLRLVKYLPSVLADLSPALTCCKQEF